MKRRNRHHRFQCDRSAALALPCAPWDLNSNRGSQVALPALIAWPMHKIFARRTHGNFQAIRCFGRFLSANIRACFVSRASLNLVKRQEILVNCVIQRRAHAARCSVA
jgi:hypothetical protein